MSSSGTSAKYKVSLLGDIWLKIDEHLISDCLSLLPKMKTNLGFHPKDKKVLGNQRLYATAGKSNLRKYIFSVPHIVTHTVNNKSSENFGRVYADIEDISKYPEKYRKGLEDDNIAAGRLVNMKKGIHGKHLGDYKSRANVGKFFEIDIRFLDLIARFFEITGTLKPDEEEHEKRIERLIRKFSTEREYKNQGISWQPCSVEERKRSGISKSRKKTSHRYHMLFVSENDEREDMYRLLRANLTLTDILHGSSIEAVEADASLTYYDVNNEQQKLSFKGSTNIVAGTDQIVRIYLEHRSENQARQFIHITIYNQKPLELASLRAAYFTYTSYTLGKIFPHGNGLLIKNDESTTTVFDKNFEDSGKKAALIRRLSRRSVDRRKVLETYHSETELWRELQNDYPKYFGVAKNLFGKWFEVFHGLGPINYLFSDDDDSSFPGIDRTIIHIDKTGSARLFSFHRNKDFRVFTGHIRLTSELGLIKISLPLSSPKYTLYFHYPVPTGRQIEVGGVLAGNASDGKIVSGRVLIMEIPVSDSARWSSKSFRQSCLEYRSDLNNPPHEFMPRFFTFRSKDYNRLIQLDRYSSLVKFFRGDLDRYIQDQYSVPTRENIRTFNLMKDVLASQKSRYPSCDYLGWTLLRTRTDPDRSYYIKVVPIVFHESFQITVGEQLLHAYSTNTFILEEKNNLIINVYDGQVCVESYVFRTTNIHSVRDYVMGVYLSQEKHSFPIAGKVMLVNYPVSTDILKRGYIDRRSIPELRKSGTVTNKELNLLQYALKNLSGHVENYSRMTGPKDINPFDYKTLFLECFELKLVGADINNTVERIALIQLLIELVFEIGIYQCESVARLLSNSENKLLKEDLQRILAQPDGTVHGVILNDIRVRHLRRFVNA